MTILLIFLKKVGVEKPKVLDLISCPPEYLCFAGRKVEDRRVSSKKDLILCTNDATGHDITRQFFRL
jgi:hypothetical protein